MRKDWTFHFLAVLALSMATLALLACGGETTPSDDAPARGTTATSTPARDTTETSTTAPAAATEVRDSSGTSLDDYLAICSSPISGPIDVEPTLEGFATVLGEYMERLESVEPPDSVADWHYAVLAYQQALQETLDDAPEFDDEDAETLYLVTAVFPTVLPYQPIIDAAISGMDPDVYARMVEAGCIDEEGFGFGFGDDASSGGRIITEFASISAGGNHTCGVGTDGYVGCWGDDWNGSTMPPDGTFASVSAGEYHTCGVRTDGALACWGSDSDGEGHAARGRIRLGQCRTRAQLRGADRRRRRLLGERRRRQGNPSRRCVLVRQCRRRPQLRCEDRRLPRLLGRRLLR